eukprot:g29891.t1
MTRPKDKRSSQLADAASLLRHQRARQGCKEARRGGGRHQSVVAPPLSRRNAPKSGDWQRFFGMDMDLETDHHKEHGVGLQRHFPPKVAQGGMTGAAVVAVGRPVIVSPETQVVKLGESPKGVDLGDVPSAVEVQGKAAPPEQPVAAKPEAGSGSRVKDKQVNIINRTCTVVGS